MSTNPSPPESDNSIVMSPTAWSTFQDWVNKAYGVGSDITLSGDSSVTFSQDTQNLLNEWLATGTPSGGKTIAPLGGKSVKKLQSAPGAASIGQEIINNVVLVSILVVIFGAITLISGSKL